MIIQIIGLPGSGKTELAKALKERINAIHLNADEVRATVNSENAESTITMVGNYNNVTTSATGYAGHMVNIDHTGDYTNFNITQAGATETNSITIESTTSGTAQTPSTICVYQSNTGTSGC